MKGLTTPERKPVETKGVIHNQSILDEDGYE